MTNLDRDANSDDDVNRHRQPPSRQGPPRGSRGRWDNATRAPQPARSATPSPRPRPAHAADTARITSESPPIDSAVPTGSGGAHAAPDTDGATSGGLREVVEWVAVVVVALVAALVIREYFVQAFEIPSQSMENTVNVGDRILVNKLSYTFGEVERGDLVVFERGTLTEGNTEELIKRAIGLPGETVELREDGFLYIWGPGEGPEDAIALNEPYLAEPERVRRPDPGDPVTIDIWDERCLNQPRETGRCTLDNNSFFMMGDNRFNSTDSRSFGPVPAENVVGRAFFRIWPVREIGGL